MNHLFFACDVPCSESLNSSDARWKKKKIRLGEEHRIRRRLEAAEALKGQISAEDEKKELMDALVQEQMGILYYLMPWERSNTQMKIEKRQKIEEDLRRQVENEDEQSEDGINLVIK